jgi:nucleotide-binding universal stress UspA family protein
MSNIRKILVPYDGSEQSEIAVLRAIELAEGFVESSEITLLNVIPEIVIPPALIESPRFRSKVTGEEVDADIMIKELCQELKVEAAQKLDEKGRKIQARHRGEKVGIKTRVLIGYPSEEIIKFAKEDQTDLIVMGNIGLSGLARLRALGSVSRTVTERAPCPVMIVR